MIAATPYQLEPRDPQAGDNMFACIYTGEGHNRCIGMVRENGRTGDYQAKTLTRSRYFGTKTGAAHWLIRQAKTSNLV